MREAPEHKCYASRVNKKGIHICDVCKKIIGADTPAPEPKKIPPIGSVISSKIQYVVFNNCTYCLTGMCFEEWKENVINTALKERIEKLQVEKPNREEDTLFYEAKKLFLEEIKEALLKDIKVYEIHHPKI